METEEMITGVVDIENASTIAENSTAMYGRIFRM